MRKYSCLFVVFLFLTGCAQNKTLSLPDNAEWVTVSMQLPDTVEAEALKVMYRSEECQKKIITMNGDMGYISGFNLMEYALEKQGREGYEKKVAIQGGGSCDWMLSNITLGIKYKDALQFGQDITENYPSRIVIIFDDNKPQQSSGGYEKIHGDLVIEKEYYPLISENNIGKHSKSLLLFSERSLFMYKVDDTKKILFKPIIHSESVVRWVSMKERKLREDGGYHTVIYPDGFIDNKAGSDPDFNKLQAITKSTKTKK